MIKHILYCYSKRFSINWFIKINPKYSNDSKSGFTKSYYTTLKIDDNFSERLILILNLVHI
jgi:hypothetical protein